MPKIHDAIMRQKNRRLSLTWSFVVWSLIPIHLEVAFCVQLLSRATKVAPLLRGKEGGG